MCGYSDLTPYETDDERNAVCAEMARMLRIVPLSLTAAASPSLSPDAGEAAVVGGLDTESAA